MHSFRKSIYKTGSIKKVPPVAPTVIASDDFSIECSQDTAILNSTLIEGTSSIDTIQWSKVSGTGTPIFGDPSSLNTSVSGLQAESDYTFRITVIDLNGLTSFDEITLFRNQGSEVDLPIKTALVDNGTTNILDQQIVHSFTVNPSLVTGENIRLYYDVTFAFFRSDINNESHFASVQTNRNGNIITSKSYQKNHTIIPTGAQLGNFTISDDFIVYPGDTIDIALLIYGEVGADESLNASSQFILTNAIYNTESDKCVSNLNPTKSISLQSSVGNITTT